jgi:hypothetical protein
MNPKYPSIQEMIQKLQEAGRTPIVPAPNRWFADPVKHPFQQKMIERVLAQTGQGREGFPSGSYINPQTGEPMDFDIMHDLGVAIDPNTGRPMMSGIKSDLTHIDPKYGSITKSNLVRKGLFKHEGGDDILKNLAFLATIEKSGKGHHYGLSTHYASPAELVNTMTGQNPTLRPHSRGDIFGVGDEVGRISIQGKHHPVYEKLLVAPAGSDVQGKKLHKAQGGVAHMTEGGSFVGSLVDTFPSLAPLASAFGYEKPTEAPAYNPLSAFPADTLPSSMPETVKFYRADPAGKFGGKEGLETLPTKFSAGKVDDPSTLYRYARMAGAANKYGYPTMSPEEVAAFAIKEGRADLGHNDMTLGNKQEKDFDKKLDTLHDIPIHDKNFLTALMAKKSTADRFGVSLPEAWNGLGVNSAGQSGRDYARNWGAQKAAALHPKNKEFMNFVRNAYEEGRKHGLIPNKNTQASAGQAPYKQGGIAHMANGGQYQSIMEDYNQPPRLPTAEEEAIEPVYPEEYLIGSGFGKSAINAARGLGNKVLSSAEMALRPAVKNDVVVSKGISTKDFPIRMPNSDKDITHAYRNMSQAEYDAAKKSGYFEANPYAKYEEGKKWWSGGDELGKFGREWKGGKDAITVRVPRNKVPENKAVRFKDVEKMKHGGITHAHHLDIEERPL